MRAVGSCLSSARCVMGCRVLLLAGLVAAGSWAGADEDVGVAPLRAPKQGGVYVVAHRGAHDGVPENSLAAYARAIELGADFVEIDVRLTKDGELVSVHNAKIDDYVEGASGRVGDFTLEELRGLDIGSRVGAEWKGTRIPTVDEIFELCRGKCGVYLDLKEPKALPALAEKVREYGMETDVLWYGPIYMLGVLKGFQQSHPEFILMPDPIAEKGIARLVKELHPRVIAATWNDYSPSFVEKCHAAGAVVIVDESDPSCWEDAIAWGSDGIQTDHPVELIELLKKREAAE